MAYCVLCSVQGTAAVCVPSWGCAVPAVLAPSQIFCSFGVDVLEALSATCTAVATGDPHRYVSRHVLQPHPRPAAPVRSADGYTAASPCQPQNEPTVLWCAYDKRLSANSLSGQGLIGCMFL